MINIVYKGGNKLSNSRQCMNNLKCLNPSLRELDGSNLIITERVNTLAQSGSDGGSLS